MKISLVVPAYNEEKYVGQCLESVQKYGSELFEIIVINNASTDRTAEIARSFEKVKVVDELKKGLPFARNRGLAEAQGDIVAFADADSQIPEGWVSKIIKEFQKNDGLVCLSGPYIYYDTSAIQNMMTNLYWIFIGIPSYHIIGYMSVLGNFVATREALQKVGGFDETIAFYGDDTDIARKLHKIGKVKFSRNFFMYSSARRLKGDGTLVTVYRYCINFLSIVFIGRAITTNHKDIR